MASRRFLISLILAVVLHLIVLIILQALVKSEKSQLPEYSGPLFVQIEDSSEVMREEVPVIEQTLPETEAALEAHPEEAELEIKEPEQQEFPPEESITSEEKQPTIRAEDIPIIKAEDVVEPSEPYLPYSPYEWIREEEFPQPPPLSREDSTPEKEDWTLPGDQEQYWKDDRALSEQGEETEPEAALLDLSQLDEKLPSKDEVKDSGRDYSAESREDDIATQPEEGREGIIIQWDDPAEGRELTSMHLPEIPAWVGQQGLRLKVVVSFLVTPQGYISKVEVEKSSGYTDVDVSVLKALRRWTFEPVKITRNVRGRVPYTISPR